MKKKSRILIFLLSAVITFGSLFAFIGKPKYAKHFDDCHQKEEVQNQVNE